MTDRPLLDTHAWIWWVSRDRRLGRATIDALDALPADGRPLLSSISLWEVATLVACGRVSLATSLEDWLAAAAHPRSVTLVPIDAAIAAGVAALPESFHRDPADRVIVATCRVLNVSLLTKDRLILRSRLVSSWKP